MATIDFMLMVAIFVLMIFTEIPDYLILDIDFISSSSALMPERARTSKMIATKGKQTAKFMENVPMPLNIEKAMNA